MSTQDVSGAHALIAFLGQDHDHESARTNIFDVVAQMLVSSAGPAMRSSVR